MLNYQRVFPLFIHTFLNATGLWQPSRLVEDLPCPFRAGGRFGEVALEAKKEDFGRFHHENSGIKYDVV